jgi:3-hydroxyisobutyrate dehydrogenase-like beta-hydroxyacid dehydrogenase
MNKEVIGFIGIGNMGDPMAARLLAAGHQILIYDVSSSATQALAQQGAQVATSIEEVANGAPLVLLSLPTPAIVATVVRSLATGTCVKHVIDFSTIGPAAGSAAAKVLAEAGITYVDAPVSGGVPGAKAGTLAVMVSCSTATFESLHPLLSTFGKPFHVGEQSGQAQTMKLVNNLLSAAAIAISSEAMAMGVKGGLNPRIMLDVINAGSGRNSATQDKFPRSILPGTFDYGFGTGLAYKDVRLCVDEAENLGVPMVVGSAVREMLAITQSLHGAESDYTSMCKVVESWAGVEVRG